MIDPTKLVRSALLALALMFLAPLTGVGGHCLRSGRQVARSRLQAGDDHVSICVRCCSRAIVARFSDGRKPRSAHGRRTASRARASTAFTTEAVGSAVADVDERSRQTPIDQTKSASSTCRSRYRLEPVADGRVRVDLRGRRRRRAPASRRSTSPATTPSAPAAQDRSSRTKETGLLSWLFRTTTTRRSSSTSTANSSACTTPTTASRMRR